MIILRNSLKQIPGSVRTTLQMWLQTGAPSTCCSGRTSEAREAMELCARPPASPTRRLPPLCRQRSPQARHQLLPQRQHLPQVWVTTGRNGFLDRCFATLLAFPLFPFPFQKWNSEVETVSLASLAHIGNRSQRAKVNWLKVSMKTPIQR